MWITLKDTSFAQVFLGIYSIILQNAFLKIQICIASRFANSPDVDPAKGEEINKKYLNFFADYSQTIGIEKISKVLYTTVTDVLAHKKKEDLSSLITYNQIVDIFKKIREKFEVFPKKDQASKKNTFIDYLLPPENLLDNMDDSQHEFRQMVIETNKIVHMSSFWEVIRSCLDDAFNWMYDLLLEHAQDRRKQTNRSTDHMIGDSINFVDYILFMARKGFNCVLPSNQEDILKLKLYTQMNQDTNIKDLCSIIFFPENFFTNEKTLKRAS